MFAQGGFEGDEQQTIFDDMYSMIVGFESLESDTKEYLLKTFMDAEICATTVSLDGLTTVAKTNIKVYIYFFLQLLKVVEAFVEKSPQTAMANASKGDDKGKAKKGGKAKSANSDFDWSAWRPSILKLCLELLEIDNSKLYSMGIVPEVLLNCYWEYALMLLEKRPSGTGGHNASEIGIRNACIDIICLSTKLFCGNDTSGSYISLATALINSLTTAEYMAQYVADVCRKSNQLLVKEILIEIGKPHIAKMPSVKNVGTFIEILTKLNPELIISNLPVINGQVDSPAHQIR